MTHDTLYITPGVMNNNIYVTSGIYMGVMNNQTLINNVIKNTDNLLYRYKTFDNLENNLDYIRRNKEAQIYFLFLYNGER